MKYTKDEIIKIVRGYTNKYYRYKNKKYMRIRRLSFMNIPAVRYNSAL